MCALGAAVAVWVVSASPVLLIPQAVLKLRGTRESTRAHKDLPESVPPRYIGKISLDEGFATRFALLRTRAFSPP
jgi:hypothetical protein